MIASIFKNLIGYDFLIIGLAAFNGFYIIPRLRLASKRLERNLRGKIYKPIELIMDSFVKTGGRQSKSLDLHELQDLREKEVFMYHIFDTINSIFPLLGILGTIIGLLRMVNTDAVMVMSNFTLALTSTFWGLIFSILFKAIDGILAPVYYQNQENLGLIYERMDIALGKGKDYEIEE